jgi:catechol 2,3-dioxygenase-like lactoylglutathione lyase family enzyme
MLQKRSDAPSRITHVVFNSADVAVAQRFFEEALGFRLSDRTEDHGLHALQQRPPQHRAGRQRRHAEPHRLRDAGLRAVMRGAGRMSDAGWPIEWGPGRHGPGNNVFAYFVGRSDDFVIEYTADVLQVDDSYAAGGPSDWKLAAGPLRPVGRVEAAVGPHQAGPEAIQFTPL